MSVQPRTAILIPGLLRLADVNATEMARLAQGCDLFVCTNRSEQAQLAHLPPPTALHLVEEDSHDARMERSLKAMRDGAKLLQWQKLAIAYADMQAEEARRGARYDLVVKLRTDLLLGPDTSLAFEHDHDSKIVCMNTDYYFISGRDNWDIIVSFFEKSLTRYYDRAGEYMPFNARSVIESDLYAARFDRLKLPSTLAGDASDRRAWNRILRDHAEEITATRRRDTPFRCLHAVDRRVVFPSEPAFLHHLLDNGLAIKQPAGRVSALNPARRVASLAAISAEIIEDRPERAVDIFVRDNLASTTDLSAGLVTYLRARRGVACARDIHQRLLRRLGPNPALAHTDIDLLISEDRLEEAERRAATISAPGWLLSKLRMAAAQSTSQKR